MSKDWFELYGDKEVLAKRAAEVKAMQDGGVAPAQPVAPQQGGEANPEQMLQDFMAAMQANDEATAREIAFAFTSMVAGQMAQNAQGGMRNGGVTKKIVFKKK